jgi:hypothetical protein
MVHIGVHSQQERQTKCHHCGAVAPVLLVPDQAHALDLTGDGRCLIRRAAVNHQEFYIVHAGCLPAAAKAKYMLGYISDAVFFITCGNNIGKCVLGYL